MTERACSNCGHPLSPTARFCAHCGADVSQPGATFEQPTAPVETLPPEPAAQPVPWRAVEAIGIFIVSIIPTIPLGILIAAKTCDRFVGSREASCLRQRDILTGVSVAVQELALLAAVLLWVRLIHKRGPGALGFRRFSLKNMFIGIGVGLGGLVVAGIISTALTSLIENVTNKPVESPKQIPLQDHPASIALILVGVSVIVLAPLAEEAFFRGFLLRGLRRWLRPGWAIVLSAAVFGVAHVIPLIMLPIFGLGVLLASIVEARGSLFPSIFAHATFNAVGFIQLFVHR